MKLLEDYSWVRGVCYQPHSDEQVKRELGYGKRVNLNTVRFWLSMWEWDHNHDNYIASLKSFFRVCNECGYYCMPVIFNGNMLDPDTLTEKYREISNNYCADIVNTFKDEPALLMWDVMNEPACNPWIEACKEPEEKEKRYQTTWSFVRRYCDYVRSLDSVNAITVGYTTAWEVEPTVESVDVISFHDYSGTRASIERNYSLADSLSKKYGKPVIQTETGCLARSNPYDMTLEMCQKYHMGWVVYELMIRGRCDSEHGVFYPDGTVRDPATISAMMGCFRCRDTNTIILPVPNREGAGERALNGIKQALAEYTCDAFDYRPSDIGKLLEACEYAANLLECCDMIPMACPPTARILAYRRAVENGEKVSLAELRRFAYDLALRIKDTCELL